jgi:hypothetical protein
MNRYVDLSLGRIWRLTLVMNDVENEYIVPESRLAALITGIAIGEPRVVSFRCVPYQGTSQPDVWMASGPPHGSRTAGNGHTRRDAVDRRRLSAAPG